jgi:O-antigen/teichoic acid export membrane protein
MRSIAFIRGLSASWFATLLAVVYSVATVPLALRYLTTEEFGLWMLVVQIGGYFILIEMGITAASSRLLIDKKDHKENGEYASMILAASAIFALQGLVIGAAGYLLAPSVADVLGLPLLLRDDAAFLIRWLCFANALSFSLRTIGCILYASKRLDVMHLANGIGLVSAFFALWTVLKSGQGLQGLPIVFLLPVIVSMLFQVVAVFYFGLLPPRGHWKLPSQRHLLSLFTFGKDIFLVHIGGQILEASQLILLSRTMGVGAAAVWSVSSKLFSLVYQVVTKIEGTAFAFLAEMQARSEAQLLYKRFRQIVQLTGTATISGVILVAVVNQYFVSWWAKPSLVWSSVDSVLLAAVIFINAILRCHTDFVSVTKHVGAMKYIVIIEAAAFLILGYMASLAFGISGIIMSALCCALVFRFPYCVFRTAHYFRVPWTDVALRWQARAGLIAAFLTPFAILAHVSAEAAPKASVQLLLALAIMIVPAFVAAIYIGLPTDLRLEVGRRIPLLSFMRL